ncbi:MAG: hypothetical protein A2X12_11510 [Bacteroidetes bacterium GWE2_29_8]|nr:MAG: hypothetical protein A2X12_11510 [Bacteroidetes bacterium GWE2_29_8]OFY13971.1 MAG: hypothetical protein A2X02_09120 [Bacteroidetes bacterium GWF2_29_10]
MKKYLPYIIAVLLIVFSNKSFSQNTEEFETIDSTGKPVDVEDYNKYRLPSISIGVGFLSFNGDLHPLEQNIRSLSSFNYAANISVEQRIKNFIGVGLNFLYGTVTAKDHQVELEHRNFQSTIMQGDFNIYFHFDNNVIIKKSSRFAPYIYVGIGYTMFDSKTDLLNDKSVAYNYWTDGTIRDHYQDLENPQIGNVIKRDYKYETSLDTIAGYKNNAISFPIGIGVKFKLSDIVETNLSASYYFTNSDNIDGTKGYNSKSGLINSKMDGFLYSSASIKFNLGGKSSVKKKTIPETEILPIDTIPLLLADTVKVIDTLSLQFALNEMDSLSPEYIDRLAEEGGKDGKKVIEDLESLEKNGGKQPYVNKIDRKYKYKVQIASLNNDQKREYFIKNFNISEDNLVVDYYEGSYKYSVGFDDLEDAKAFNKDFKQKSGLGSFVVTYKPDDNREILPSGLFKLQPDGVSIQPQQNMQVELEPDNVLYKVQIGSSAKKEAKDYYVKKYGVTDQIFVERYRGAYKYFIGEFTTYKGAKQYCMKLRDMGIDAFVISYNNNRRITVKDAIKVTVE